MIGDLYLGNITTKGAVTDHDPIFLPIIDRFFEVRPPEPSDQSLKYFVDMIFYHRVNALGDVFTSIVYLGDFRLSSLNDKIKYDPKFLFRNTAAEQTFNIDSETSDFSGLNYIKPHGLLPLYDNSVDFEEFKLDGKLSNTVGPMSVSFDGWYTIMTINVTEDDQTLNQGSLQWIATNNFVPYQSNGTSMIQVSDFNNSELKVGELPYLTGITNNYKKQDFFVLRDFKDLYRKELEYFGELKYDGSYKTIIEKGKILELLLETKDFKLAQQTLQTVEDSVLLQVIK